MSISTSLAITITALNLTGAAFQGVSRGLRGIQNTATSVGRSITGFNDRLNSFSSGIGENAGSGVKGLLALNAGLMTVDLTARTLSATFSTLGNVIGDSLNYELEQMQGINTVVQVMGVSGKQAATFMQDLSQQIAIAGRELPVSAGKIGNFARSLIDDYSIALKSAGGSLAQIQQVLVGDSGRLALAQAISGTTDAEAQAAITNLLSGAVGARGINRYKFFANNVTLRNNLAEAMNNQGLRSLADVSFFDRIKILNSALEDAFPQESIDRLAQTGQATISRFFDLLFDREIGLFSIFRDLDSAKEGYQSVYFSFVKGLNTLIGGGGIFEQIGELSGLDSNFFGLGLKSVVEGINGKLNELNLSLQSMSSFDSGAIGSSIGNFTAELMNGVTVGILGAIGDVNWGGVLKGTVRGIGSFFANLDWRVYMSAGLALLAFKVVPIVVGGIAAVLGGLPLLIGGAIVAGVAGIVALIANYWDDVMGAIRGLFDTLKSKIFGDQESVSAEPVAPKPIQSYSDTIGLSYGFGASGFVPMGAQAAIAKEMAMAPNGTYPVIANSSELVVPGDQIASLLRAGNRSQTIVNLSGININVSGGNAWELAQEIMQILEDQVVLGIEAAIT